MGRVNEPAGTSLLTCTIVILCDFRKSDREREEREREREREEREREREREIEKRGR